jgi:hypothetical protein
MLLLSFSLAHPDLEAPDSASARVQATSRPTNIRALNCLALTLGSPLVRFCPPLAFDFIQGLSAPLGECVLDGV